MLSGGILEPVGQPVLVAEALPHILRRGRLVALLVLSSHRAQAVEGCVRPQHLLRGVWEVERGAAGDEVRHRHAPKNNIGACDVLTHLKEQCSARSGGGESVGDSESEEGGEDESCCGDWVSSDGDTQRLGCPTAHRYIICLPQDQKRNILHQVQDEGRVRGGECCNFPRSLTRRLVGVGTGGDGGPREILWQRCGLCRRSVCVVLSSVPVSAPVSVSRCSLFCLSFRRSSCFGGRGGETRER